MPSDVENRMGHMTLIIPLKCFIKLSLMIRAYFFWFLYYTAAPRNPKNSVQTPLAMLVEFDQNSHRFENRGMSSCGAPHKIEGSHLSAISSR